MIIPSLDLNDPAIDVAVAHGFIPGLKPSKGNNAPQSTIPTQPQQAPQTQQPTSQPTAEVKDTNLESMVRAVAQIELDEYGHWDYHGHSSGLSFVRRMREQLGDIMGPDTQATPFVKSRPKSNVIDSPKSGNYDSPSDFPSPGYDLAPEHIARQACSKAVYDAASLLRPVHLPTFWASFQRLYSIPAEQYTDEDHKFLPLYYSTMAVGTLFGPEDDNDQQGYEGAINRGYVRTRMTE